MKLLITHSGLHTLTCLQWVGQRQLQDETRKIQVLGFGATYIRGLTPLRLKFYLCEFPECDMIFLNYNTLWNVVYFWRCNGYITLDTVIARSISSKILRCGLKLLYIFRFCHWSDLRNIQLYWTALKRHPKLYFGIFTASLILTKAILEGLNMAPTMMGSSMCR